jgi:hypothetical protein
MGAVKVKLPAPYVAVRPPWASVVVDGREALEKKNAPRATAVVAKISINQRDVEFIVTSL